MTEPAPEQPQQDPPPFDPANGVFAQFGPGPSQMSCGVSQMPDGTSAVLVCLRTGSTTLTVVLDRDTAMKWGHMLKQTAGRVSPLVIAGAGQMPPPPPGVPR